MSIVFKTYHILTPEERTSIYQEATIVFDTNVLMMIMEASPKANKIWFDILNNDKVNPRLWIPFQVMLEFLRNSQDVVKGDEQLLNSTFQSLDKQLKSLNSISSAVNDSIKKLCDESRAVEIQADEFTLPKDLFQEPVEVVNQLIEKMKLVKSQTVDKANARNTRLEIIEIFKDKMGECFSQKELDEIYVLGEKRFADSIPPGFGDAAKPGEELHEDRLIKAKFGDLIIWKEIIRKAKSEKIGKLLFITNDKNKGDWFILDKENNSHGPRLELLNEIYHAVPEMEFFHITRSPTFLNFIENNTTLKEPTKDAIEDAEQQIAQRNNETFGFWEAFRTLTVEKSQDDLRKMTIDELFRFERIVSNVQVNISYDVPFTIVPKNIEAFRELAHFLMSVFDLYKSVRIKVRDHNPMINISCLLTDSPDQRGAERFAKSIRLIVEDINTSAFAQVNIIDAKSQSIQIVIPSFEFDYVN